MLLIKAVCADRCNQFELRSPFQQNDYFLQQMIKAKLCNVQCAHCAQCAQGTMCTLWTTRYCAKRLFWDEKEKLGWVGVHSIPYHEWPLMSTKSKSKTCLVFKTFCIFWCRPIICVEPFTPLNEAYSLNIQMEPKYTRQHCRHTICACAVPAQLLCRYCKGGKQLSMLPSWPSLI